MRSESYFGAPSEREHPLTESKSGEHQLNPLEDLRTTLSRPFAHQISRTRYGFRSITGWAMISTKAPAALSLVIGPR